MSTIVPENLSSALNDTVTAADERNNVTMTSQETTTVTETTSKKTQNTNGTTTNGIIRTTVTENTKTTTKEPKISTTKFRTKFGTTTAKISSTSSAIVNKRVVTNATSFEGSLPVGSTQTSSTLRKITYDHISSNVPFTNATSNSTSSPVTVSTKVDESAIGVKRMSDDCTETIAIVAGVCAGLVLLNLLGSVLCFYRLRHKWRAKVQLERKKTDIWSMATYNNTIVNENFSDFQLASSTNYQSRKASKISENSIQFYDPFSNTVSQSPFGSNHDDIVMRSDALPSESRDHPTLRRNTVSAPDEIDAKLQSLRVQSDYGGFNEDRDTLRGRSSTFTVGRKHNVDRHVLLSHEELVDDNSVVGMEQTGSRYNLRTNSYHITEL